MTDKGKEPIELNNRKGGQSKNKRMKIFIFLLL